MALYVKYQEPKPVPEGIYVARLDGLESINHETYGGGIKWTFTIQDQRPEFNNLTVIAMCSTKVSSKSKLFQWLQAFGVLLDADQTFDVESLLGQSCRVKIVNKTQSKIVNGEERTITFSNIVAMAPYTHQQASNAPMSTQGAPAPAVNYTPPVQKRPVPPPQAAVIPPNQLNVDEEFDF